METPPAGPPSRLHRCLGDLLLVGLLVGLAWKVGYDVSCVRDLPYGDEAGYIWWGSLIPEEGLPKAESCPLYCLWYHVLSCVQPDPARRYYLSWQLLVCLLPVSVYLLARAVGGTRAVSLLAGFLVLNSGLLNLWTSFPAHLAAVVLLLGTAAATRCRSWAWSLAALGVTLLLASYIRPECAVAFLVFCLAGLAGVIGVVLRHRPGWWRVAGPVLVVLLLTGAGLKGIGNPLGDGRSFAAFGQHYAVNVLTARKDSLDPALYRWQEFCQSAFGKAQTMGEAWKVNRRAVLWHVGVNLRGLLPSLRWLIRPKLELPPLGQRLLSWGLRAVLVLGFVGLLWRLRSPGEPPAGRRGLLLALALLSCLSVPAVASCLVIYPGARYLLPGVILFVSLALAGLVHWRPLRRVAARLDTRAGLVLLAALCAVTTPNLAHGWDLQSLGRQRPPPPQFSFQRRVRALRELSLQGTPVVLDGTLFSTAAYAGLPVRFVDPSTKHVGFRAFLRQGKISLVLLDDILLNDAGFRDDPEFKEFAAGTWEGFTYVSVPDLPLRIAVRKDLLREPR
jgi:hypothetical protein